MATARIAGVAMYPGALTPTEILSAHRSGAAAVKLFPASAMSPGYLKDVRGPFPGIPVIPTGGVGVEDIPSWLAAGAAAVGLGTPLLGGSLADGPDAALAERARRAVAAVAGARS
jgi:2-dehydro-3-deoxyphosphogluconate aldolase/(4S)-4-hydroxy-2-oxoglutarate aldolase